ncbi:hypothetical protein [Mangrovibacter yixingensis]|uniref:hypothetical protein n=1 Tax=Mangrovibacter yixingensis TaxID=1529639 RepID=UPI001CFBD08A|nr:hypothetical protein [Mangrovibacter yixingensis]
MKIFLLILGVFVISSCNDESYTLNDFLINENLRNNFKSKCVSNESKNCSYFLSSIDIIQKAEGGDIDKQMLLGEVYLAAGNFKDSIHWLTMAADNDDDIAFNKLGEIAYFFETKKDFTVNEMDAFHLLNKWDGFQRKRKGSVLRYYLNALSDGDFEALISLGIMYWRGEGVEQNYDIAISYFMRYTEAEAVKAPGWGEYYLAYMYIDGHGFNKSEISAISLFDKSCKLGFVLSCIKLGDLYFYGGNEFEPDYKRSTELLDVYFFGEYIDIRAITSADNLVEMYKNGGFGIHKNPNRVQQLHEIICHNSSYPKFCR